jgi:hypothetical protein
LVRFASTGVLGQNRRLRMIAGRLVHDNFMSPVRAVVIEMNRGCRSDLNWVKLHCEKSRLSELSSIQNGVLVKVVDIGSDGLQVRDDSVSECVSVKLSEKEVDYARLLHVGDLIVIWKPRVVDGKLAFCEVSLVLRLPILDAAVHDSRDCELHGVVDTVAHSCELYEWVGCQCQVLGNSGVRTTIVFPKETGFEARRILSSVRHGHFIWLFHMIESGRDRDVFVFSAHSVIFNLNCIRGLLDSMIVRPIPICDIGVYDSVVVRSVIVDIHVSIVRIHVDCGCVVNDMNCARCSVSYGERHRQDLLMRIVIEDGGLESVVCYGRPESCDLLGYDVNDWESQLPRIRDKLLESRRGMEYVFFISRSRAIDVGLMEGDGEVWIIDGIALGRDETSRTVRVLCDLLGSSDRYAVGFAGDSCFHNRGFEDGM